MALENKENNFVKIFSDSNLTFVCSWPLAWFLAAAFICRGGHKDSVGRGKYFEFGAQNLPNYFYPSPKIFFTPP